MLNGTGYAPNITVVDLNGVTHDVYEYLDSGYVVVLELVSASCATCAAYAAGTEKFLQSLWPLVVIIRQDLSVLKQTLTQQIQWSQILHQHMVLHFQ